MAINTQKFLPSSKGGALSKVNNNIIKGSSSIGFTNKSVENLGIIRIKVIQIDDILKGTLAIQKKKLTEEKKKESSERREKIEEKLETKPNAEKGKIKMPSLPRMGFLDWVKNFIGNIILGYFAVRLVDHLPKIIPIVKFLGKATDFVLGVGGKLLDGLVTFIDWGYKAYDATRGFVKNLFGDGGVKQFDQLSGTLNQFLNLALIAGMTVAGSGGFGGGKGRGTAVRPGGKPKVTTSGGRTVGRPDVRNPFRQRPKVTVGRGGNRAILSSVRPFLKRIPLPLVGALIDFGLSVALGENPGRAAFRAIGAGLLGAVGAAAGTVVPVAGNFIGGLLGGAAGDAIGGVLYDFLFGGKTSSAKGKTTKKAGGGITRAGRPQRGVRRTLTRKGKYKRKLAPKKPGDVEATSPGSDVGGEQKLFGLFPDPFKMMQKATDVMNPFKVIQKAGKNLGESDYFGPILAITSKILLGQKPTQEDYKNVGLGINMLVAKGIDDGKLKGGLAAFAEGGFVDPKALNAISQGGDISDWVAKAFKESTESNSQKTLREIQENLRLKPSGTRREDDRMEPDQPVDSEDGGYSTNAGDYKELLDLIASKESSSAGGYNAYNEGGARGGYQVVGYGGDSRKGPLRRSLTDMTIKEIMAHQKNTNPPIHAAGRYQIIGSTLAALIRGNYGPTGVSVNDKYTPDVQDKLGIALIKYRLKTGATTENFINEWRGLKFVDKTKLQAAINKAQRGRTYRIDVQDNLSMDAKSMKGYRVTRNGATIKNYSELPAHHTYQTTSDGRRVQDFTLYKGKNFVNVPVPSPVTGKVTWTGPTGGGGNWVEIQSKDGKVELGHFNKITAKVGQDVQAFKSILGLQGYTGRINPPGPDGTHVHIQAPDKIVSRYVNTLASGSAYEKGGFTKSYPHIAMIGEKGKEFVIDADSTAAIEGTFPGFLDAINKAKYKDAINVLSNFASYESGSEQIVIVSNTQIVAGSGDAYEGGGGLMISSNESESDPFETLYQGG